MNPNLPKDLGWFNCDTYFNQHTFRAAKLAAGAAISLCKNIARNNCANGISITRPPGHHCEYAKPMGFCYFNSVAVAVNYLKEKDLCKRILIVDWDLHHGNGTQDLFYKDKDVLYFSVHRGEFYPWTGDV